MEIFSTIKHMFPDATIENVTVILDTEGNWEIAKWDLPVLQPMKEEVETYWDTNKETILEANKPQPTELEQLKKQQDLIQSALDDLILGGAL